MSCQSNRPASDSARTATDIRLVVAAQNGQRHALDELVRQHLPLVYAVVGRALGGRTDVDDVVQDTILSMLRGLPALRNAHAFRAWLVTIAMNQVRKHRRGPAPSIPLDDLEAFADPSAEIADLTLTRLGVSAQQRDIVEAARWLDQDDRELLAAWLGVANGYTTRQDLAVATGANAHLVTVRVSRMKTRLDTARVVVQALRAAPGCPELNKSAQRWDGRPSGLWRKRFARHVRDCGRCGDLGTDLFPAEGLLADIRLTLPSADPVPHAVGDATAQAGSGARQIGTARPATENQGDQHESNSDVTAPHDPTGAPQPVPATPPTLMYRHLLRSRPPGSRPRTPYRRSPKPRQFRFRACSANCRPQETGGFPLPPVSPRQPE